MDTSEQYKPTKHSVLLSELLTAALMLKIANIDSRQAPKTVSKNEYELIAKIKQIILELEELDTETFKAF